MKKAPRNSLFKRNSASVSETSCGANRFGGLDVCPTSANYKIYFRLSGICKFKEAFPPACYSQTMHGGTFDGDNKELLFYGNIGPAA